MSEIHTGKVKCVESLTHDETFYKGINIAGLYGDHVIIKMLSKNERIRGIIVGPYLIKIRGEQYPPISRQCCGKYINCAVVWANYVPAEFCLINSLTREMVNLEYVNLWDADGTASAEFNDIEIIYTASNSIQLTSLTFGNFYGCMLHSTYNFEWETATFVHVLNSNLIKHENVLYLNEVDPLNEIYIIAHCSKIWVVNQNGEILKSARIRMTGERHAIMPLIEGYSLVLADEKFSIKRTAVTRTKSARPAVAAAFSSFDE